VELEAAGWGEMDWERVCWATGKGTQKKQEPRKEEIWINYEI